LWKLIKSQESAHQHSAIHKKRHEQKWFISKKWSILQQEYHVFLLFRYKQKNGTTICNKQFCQPPYITSDMTRHFTTIITRFLTNISYFLGASTKLINGRLKCKRVCNLWLWNVVGYYLCSNRNCWKPDSKDNNFIILMRKKTTSQLMYYLWENNGHNWHGMNACLIINTVRL